MYLLFTTPNCPRCKIAKDKLLKMNIIYEEIPVMARKENAELAKKYGVKTGGTIIDNETGKEVTL